MFAFNGVILTLVVAFIAYGAGTMVANAARNGQFLPDRSNAIFGPVRVALMLSLLAPIPGADLSQALYPHIGNRRLDGPY